MKYSGKVKKNGTKAFSHEAVRSLRKLGLNAGKLVKADRTIEGIQGGLKTTSAFCAVSVQNSSMMNSLDEWDEDTILVVPGLPGSVSAPNVGPVYPASTLVVVKRIRNAGYPIRLVTGESLREVSHHSVEEWLPVLNFGLQVLAGGAGNVLSGLLMQILGGTPRRRTLVHIRWNVQSADGSVSTFEFDGDGQAAVEAARIFERSLGYGDAEE